MAKMETAFSDFGPVPGFLSSANGCPGQNGRKSSYVLRFPARGGPVGQNINCKNIAENHPGQRGNFFSRFGTPSTGKLCFSVFGLGPDFSKCPRPKTGQNPTKSPFFDRWVRPLGPTKKYFVPEKVAENHPE